MRLTTASVNSLFFRLTVACCLMHSFIMRSSLCLKASSSCPNSFSMSCQARSQHKHWLCRELGCLDDSCETCNIQGNLLGKMRFGIDSGRNYWGSDVKAQEMGHARAAATHCCSQYALLGYAAMRQERVAAVQAALQIVEACLRIVPDHLHTRHGNLQAFVHSQSWSFLFPTSRTPMFCLKSRVYELDRCWGRIRRRNDQLITPQQHLPRTAVAQQETLAARTWQLLLGAPLAWALAPALLLEQA